MSPAGVRPFALAPTVLDPAGLAAAYAYPADPPAGRWVRANMIATVDGAAAAGAGVSGEISGAADRELLVLLRALSDAVLVGSGTVNAEGYGPARVRPAFAGFRAPGQEPVPAVAVVSASLGLDFGSPMFTEASVPTIVLTADSAPPDRLAAARKVADVVVVGGERVDLGGAVDALVARGFTRLLCEGGPGLLANVAAGGLLDEVCLTVSPTLVAGAAGRIVRGADLGSALRLRLGHALTDADGFLFLRYVVA